ncbi:DUF6183 family protein [Kitasatospora purpeofusca]|uniref:DUF6183 family protein n=1 Tax=Kitasatospora purpeofusca TaxID=67352 RepID=UPI0038601814
MGPCGPTRSRVVRARRVGAGERCGPGCARVTASAAATRRSRRSAPRHGPPPSRSPTGGAYGRLYAWRSPAAPAGAPSDAPASEVEDRVRSCAWYRFGADTPWVHRAVWDLGVLAVTPDGPPTCRPGSDDDRLTGYRSGKSDRPTSHSGAVAWRRHRTGPADCTVAPVTSGACTGRSRRRGRLRPAVSG